MSAEGVTTGGRKASLARMVIINDFEEYAQMDAAPLRQRGHDVLIQITEDARRVDFERIVDFGPGVISVGLYRQEQAFDRPIRSFEEDVLGYVPIRQMEEYPAIRVVPLLLVGHCIREEDVPTLLPYDIFLVLPTDIKLYVPKMEELATKVKSRRKLSGYLCPNCGSRLVFTVNRIELFCPRCHTAVSIIDEREALVVDERGESRTVQLAEMAAHPRGDGR